MSPLFSPHPQKVAPDGCISLIGMAAAGKTTIGRELSALINWPQMDTDNLIEATYGAPLQGIADALTKEQFLDVEGLILSRISVKRAILSTGGSAVYRPAAMEYLRRLGPLVYIEVPLPIILERIARKPERGLAIAPGQTIEDLYYERAALYEREATFTVRGGDEPPAVYARVIAEWLEQQP